ncbi:tail collar domain [Caudoviricetes sp.]|nr:tail collar domain [Caudoviricetes sp.]
MAVGEIKFLSSQNAIQAGHLVCDGGAYDPVDYPDLYSVIGNQYGGDSLEFNVPNLIGRAIFGDDEAGLIGGRSSVQLTTSNLPSHSHSLAVGTGTNGSLIPASGASLTGTAGGNPTAAAIYTTAPANPVPLAGGEAVGSGQPFFILPPYVTLIPVIQAV